MRAIRSWYCVSEPDGEDFYRLELRAPDGREGVGIIRENSATDRLRRVFAHRWEATLVVDTSHGGVRSQTLTGFKSLRVAKVRGAKALRALLAQVTT